MYRLVVALCLALSLGACGSKLEGVRAAGDGAHASQLSDAPGGPGATSPTTPGGKGLRGSGAPSATPDATVAHSGSTKTIPVTLKISSTCATPGQRMQADVVTVKNATIALTSYYFSKNHYQPDIMFVPSSADVTGTYTWTWVLRPDTPRGPAMVKVVVAKDGKGGIASAPFTVATAC